MGQLKWLYNRKINLAILRERKREKMEKMKRGADYNFDT